MKRLVDVNRPGGFPWCGDTAEVLNEIITWLKMSFNMFQVPNYTGVWLTGLNGKNAKMLISHGVFDYELADVTTNIPDGDPNFPTYNKLMENNELYTMMPKTDNIVIAKAEGGDYGVCISNYTYEIQLKGAYNPWKFCRLYDVVAQNMESRFVGVPLYLIDMSNVGLSISSASYIRYYTAKKRFVINLELSPVATPNPFTPYYIPFNISDYITLFRYDNYALNAVYVDLNSSYSVPCGCCYRDGFIVVTSPGNVYGLNQDRVRIFVTGTIQI